MPTLKFDRVVSCNSEDVNHPARNLLESESYKKWKCKTPGEKQAIVILQLESSSLITGIDIGNEHAAFVEILVGRSCSDDEFQVLLVSSSFMSPLEGRNSTNTNRVRMFTKEQLSKPAVDEKWDKVKVVCTQPFNKHVQYGLCFVTLHSPEVKSESTVPVQRLGRFVLKPEEDESPRLSAGALFARLKEKAPDTPLTGAAAIREASSPAALQKATKFLHTPQLKPLKVPQPEDAPAHSSQKKAFDLPQAHVAPKVTNSPQQPTTSTQVTNNVEVPKSPHMAKRPSTDTPQSIKKPKIDTPKTAHTPYVVKKTDNDVPKTANTAQVIKKPNADTPKNANTPYVVKKINIDTPKATPKEVRNGASQVLRPSTSTNNTKPKKLRKPFNKLLEGVVFVISGYQNPIRGNVRDMALSMGAKYKPDWDNTCTHLLCAFMHTPKYQQVLGKGHIVLKDWIEQCHARHKRIPWRRHALDKRERSKPESEDEILEEVPQASTASAPDNGSDTDFDASPSRADSGSDTEEEIQRFLDNSDEDPNYCPSSSGDSEPELSQTASELSQAESSELELSQTASSDVTNVKNIPARARVKAAGDTSIYDGDTEVDEDDGDA